MRNLLFLMLLGIGTAFCQSDPGLALEDPLFSAHTSEWTSMDMNTTQCDSSLFFIVECIDPNTIRITPAGNAKVPECDFPSVYWYKVYLDGLFEDVIGQDNNIHIQKNGGLMVNASSSSSSLPDFKLGESSVLAVSSIADPAYHLDMVITPNSQPGLNEDKIFTGYLEISVYYPASAGWTLSDILKPCGTEGDIMWGHEVHSPKLVGKYYISCPCLCDE